MNQQLTKEQRAKMLAEIKEWTKTMTDCQLVESFMLAQRLLLEQQRQRQQRAEESK